MVIGLVQGALGGIAFYFAGIGGAAVWAAAMAALSIVPGVGTAVVWVPAVIYLFVIGRTGAAVGLLVWSSAVVGTVDNFLRPFLVGRTRKCPTSWSDSTLGVSSCSASSIHHRTESSRLVRHDLGNLRRNLP